MPRTINEATTRLPDKPTVSDDMRRHYQLRPIPGQQTLDLGSAAWHHHLEQQDDAEWLRQMILEHGHCGQ